MPAVQVIVVEIVAIDVIGIDVVAINVVEIGIVKIRVIDISVVVVITVRESVGVRYVGIMVVDDRGVVPATLPGVITLSVASTTAADCRPDRNADSE